jgi:hypothetical protein
MTMRKAEGGRQKAKRQAWCFCLLPFAFCLVASAAQAQAADGPFIVIPFDNPTQEARLAWMREGAAILLTDALSAAGAPVIEREERLQAFDRLQLPAHATLSRASTIRVGEALAASAARAWCGSTAVACFRKWWPRDRSPISSTCSDAWHSRFTTPPRRPR